MASTQVEPLFTKRSVIALVAMIAVFVGILFAMGRIWYGKYGFGLWTWQAWSVHTSQLFGDPYSFSHVLHGIIFFGVLWFFRDKIPLAWRLVISTLVEIAWEVLENSPIIINRYRAATASLDYTGDSIWNSFGDVIFSILGFYIAMKLPWKWTIVFVIVIELLMLYFIKDNLTLNVLMLLYPIQAIKQWQLQ